MGRNKIDTPPRVPLSPRCPWIAPVPSSVDTIFRTRVKYSEAVPDKWFSSLDVLRKTVSVHPRALPKGSSLDMILHRVVHNPAFMIGFHSSNPSHLRFGAWSGPTYGTRLLTTLATVTTPYRMEGRFISGQRFAYTTRPEDGTEVLVWHFSTQLPDFPYCSTFRNEIMVEFVQHTEGVTATVYSNILFSSWSFFEGMIRSQSSAEISRNYKDFLDDVESFCKAPEGPLPVMMSPRSEYPTTMSEETLSTVLEEVTHISPKRSASPLQSQSLSTTSTSPVITTLLRLGASCIFYVVTIVCSILFLLFAVGPGIFRMMKAIFRTWLKSN